MIKKLLGCTYPTAKVSDGKLVLSLTDALTPVVWIIDLYDNPSLLLKTEATDDGHFVLQKIEPGADTPAVENLAFYKKKGHAVRAMDKATRALQERKSGGYSFLGGLLKMILAVFIVLVVVGYSLSKITVPAGWTDDFWGGSSATASSQTPNTSTPPARIQPSTDPDAVGVPLSADDFFEKRNPQTGPLF